MRRLLRLILRLSVLLRSTCREGHGDHNSEKITHNGNRKGSHRRRFVKFSAVAPLGFASVFWPIGRSFYFDLAMDVLKIEFQAKFFFLPFLAVGKRSAAVAGDGSVLPGGRVFFSGKGIWRLRLGFGMDESYLYLFVFHLDCPSRLI